VFDSLLVAFRANDNEKSNFSEVVSDRMASLFV
jgi:hypothetical protein